MNAGTNGSAEGLRSAVEMADRILDLVSTHAPAGVVSRDRNDQFLVLAFGRAFRCFRSIRDVAGVHAEADDASVLTRALIVIGLQSLWLATPEDPDERIRRGRAIFLASLKHLRTQARSMEALGMDPGVSSEEYTGQIEPLEAAGAGMIPPDEVIARELGLEDLYARVYRSTSDVAHYSLATALQGFDATGIDSELITFDGLRIRFKDGDPKSAEEALVLAAVVYVSFLERSEFVVSHGVFDESKALLEAYVQQRPTDKTDELS